VQTPELRRNAKRAAVAPMVIALIGVIISISGLQSADAAPVASPPSGPAAGGTILSLPVSSAVSFAHIAAGNGTSLAVAVDGTAWGWGYNAEGQLGNGSTSNSSTPVQVKVPAGHTIIQVAAAAYDSLALDSDGTLWAWGSNVSGELGTGNYASSTTPVQVKIPAGHSITQVAAGDSHSLAVASDGTVWAWGENGYGQLGNGTNTSSTTPVQVKIPAGHTITQIATGSYHSVAVASDGTVWAWGDNVFGGLGDGTLNYSSTPVQVQVPAGHTFTQVAASSYSSLAVASDGTAWGWGYNAQGQLGNGSNSVESLTPVQVQVPAGHTITQIAAGGFHSLAVGSDGTVWAWGSNSNGQLGNGTTNDNPTTTPVQVRTPAGHTITQVAGGYDHSLAVASDGTAWAWGDNALGQLGNGSSTNSSTPLQVVPPFTISAVTIGGTAVTGLIYSHGTLTFTTPAHAAGSVDILVMSNGGTQTFTAAFTYLAATVPGDGPTVLGVTGTDSTPTLLFAGLLVLAGFVVLGIDLTQRRRRRSTTGSAN